MFEAAVAERERAERERAAAELKAKAAKMRERVETRVERAIEAGRDRLAVAMGELLHLDDEDLVQFSYLHG